MEFEKYFAKVRDRPLELKFKIKNFKESPISDSKRLVVSGTHVRLSVHGSGERPDNKDFVMYHIEKDTRAAEHPMISPKPIFSFPFIFTILDVEGHKKFPQTLTLGNDIDDPSDECEERYIERSCILNNASEYLQEDTLTVVVEGTFQGWHDYYTIQIWIPSWNFVQFDTEYLEHNLKVYLPKCSAHFQNLLKYSRFFRNMMNLPMREREEERILLKNEELPAFLCMLFFLDTENLLLYEATISDLYKIALFYDIQVLLEKCRKHIGNSLRRKTSRSSLWQPLYFAIRKFATHYNDAELKSTADYYIGRLSEQMQERNTNLEMRKEFGDDIVWNTRPVSSNLIKTEVDFRRHLSNLWQKIATYKSDEVVDVNELEMEAEREQFDFYQ